MKKCKRIVSMLLVCCLLITLFPTTGLALEMTSQATGEKRMNGDSPYQSTIVEPVYAVRDDTSVLLTTVATTAETELAYPVEGGNIYFDTETGMITNCDYDVTNANIPAQINGVKVIGIDAWAFDGMRNLVSAQ